METVLIADDQAGIRALVSTTLESEEYQLVQACDGDQAWELLHQHRPTIAILDVNMPGMDGLTLTRAIRKDDELQAMRVILLTSESTERDVELGMQAGADLYLTKPFSPLELITIVEQALQEAA
jgi:DNA-binding response OmpR family regulator